MIKKIGTTSVYVKDQNEAVRFYTECLGFVIRTDITSDNGFRWVTVSPKAQEGFELVLMALEPGGGLNEEGVGLWRKLQESGQVSGGVLETDDCKGDYETLKAKGVEFLYPPNEQPWGIETTLKDSSGNWFSLLQRSSWQG